MIGAVLTTRTGRTFAALGIVFVFYEGVPVVKEIPLLDSVPLVGPFLDGISHGRVDRAFADGATAGRLAWETEAVALRQQLEDERREAQAEIDRVERAYLEQRQADNRALAALETAIAQDQPDAATSHQSCPDKPAFSRGLSNAIDAIGR